MKLTYCKECLYPATKPDLYINDQGVCSACTSFDNRKNINWSQREVEFKLLCSSLIKEGHQYHCIVPVSGGKDSHYQILKALEYGLNPLAVTATTDHLSAIGYDNLCNISKLGVDHIHVTTNSDVRRKINAYTLREVGDISWAEHVSIFTVPVRVAVDLDIPLIIWGENPQSEYGGPYKSQQVTQLDRRWLEEFGGLNGLRVTDLIEDKIITNKEAKLYTYPDLIINQVNGIFLGQYFEWDGMQNAVIAGQHGFKYHIDNVEGTGYNYENLDNLQTGIHDRFKFLKYGFGRCTDIVNNHIRRKRITKQEAKEMVLMYDNCFPRTYLGISLEEILEPLKISIEEYIKIEEKFTNKELFERRPNGRVKSLFLEDLKNS